MFKIVQTPVEEYFEKIAIDPSAGAVVIFDGTVRNHNEGHAVTSLEYQCYEKMALKEGEKILKEAMSKFSIISAICIHREGHLQIGDKAVRVWVQSAHRKDAFKACQFIIDQVKLSVPIWKREHYRDKTPKWVACHHCVSA